MSDIGLPNDAERAAQVDRIRRDAKEFKRQLQEHEGMTPEIMELVRQADDAIDREAWAELAWIYFEIARMLGPGGQWDDFHIWQFIFGDKNPPPPKFRPPPPTFRCPPPRFRPPPEF